MKYISVLVLSVLLIGCSSNPESAPSGQTLEDPTGGKPIPNAGQGTPKPGEQLPGAPAGLTMPQGTEPGK